MFERLRRLVRPAPARDAPPRSLPEELERSAARFHGWAERLFGDAGAGGGRLALIDRALGARPGGREELSEAIASDAAAALGECWRARFGGHWEEDDLHGVVLRGCAGHEGARLIPLGAILRKWDRPDGYSLEELTDSLGRRFEEEKKLPPWPGGDLPAMIEPLRGLHGEEAAAAALALAEEFRAHWGERLGASLPFSLVGVRALDGFLRTHYTACFLGGADLARAGFFLGEVGRGLFQGQWDFRGATRVEAAPLRYPELDYFPVGRIFKMMTEQPGAEPLDEYLRLIPSARAELRKQQ